MSGPDPDLTGASVPPPGLTGARPERASAQQPPPAPAPRAATADGGPDPLTSAQTEAIARVAAMAAARPAAADQGLSRAATVALVALGVLVFAMVLLALLVS
jgi:hypothetical protein